VALHFAACLVETQERQRPNPAASRTPPRRAARTAG